MDHAHIGHSPTVIIFQSFAKVSPIHFKLPLLAFKWSKWPLSPYSNIEFWTDLTWSWNPGKNFGNNLSLGLMLIFQELGILEMSAATRKRSLIRNITRVSCQLLVSEDYCFSSCWLPGYILWQLLAFVTKECLSTNSSGSSDHEIEHEPWKYERHSHSAIMF